VDAWLSGVVGSGAEDREAVMDGPGRIGYRDDRSCRYPEGAQLGAVPANANKEREGIAG
jgi:hypothetical protein